MQGYLYNVAQSFAPYFVGGAFVFAMFVATLSLVEITVERRDQVRGYVIKSVLIIWGFGLLIAAVAPANTYKRETYNKAAANAQIEQQQMAVTSDQPVVDRSRQPAMTADERAAHTRELLDYTK